jgi:uroporphyrinogen III methyltransferase/synthase
MVTAHEAIKSGGPQVRWDLIGADPHATVLGYMGVTALPNVVHELLASGLDPKTPAALIHRGSTSAQRVVKSTVSELPDAVRDADVGPPALFVIGPTVRHAEELDWFTTRPLFGERMVLIAPQGPLGEQLEMAGVELVPVPLPLTPAARLALGALPLSGCLLRDADEVEALDEERDGTAWGTDVVAWCSSPGAAERARALGWSAVVDLSDADGAAGIIAAMRKHRGR